MIKPPGPKGTLIWGSLGEFQEDTLGFLVRSAENYGDIVRFRFAHMQAYLINNPELIKQALITNADCFDKHTRSAKQIRATCGDSLLSFNQQTWARHRKLIQPVFQPRFVETMDDIIDQQTAHMMERWYLLAETGEAVDIVSEINQLVIQISTRALFSSELDTNKIEQALTVLLNDTWRRLQAPFVMSSLSPIFHKRPFKQALSEVDKMVFNIISKRRDENTTHDDVLSRLLSAHQGNGDIKLTDSELRDAVITLLLAGHETTANALAWSFYLLAEQPHKIPTNMDFKNVFLETVRLYPSIWIIERRTIKPTKIGDYVIPKGTSVLISPYVLHRHKDYWKTSDQFDPDRFSEAECDQRPRNAFLPFGLGEHRCVGLHMATKISTRVLEIAHKQFRLQLVSKNIPQPNPGITLRHNQNILVRVKRNQPT